jgi:hypothetical protein
MTDHLRYRAALHDGALVGLRNGALVLLATSMLALVVATPAVATPKGDFAVFAQCPLANPEVNLCFYVTSTGGEFNIGSTKVPINKVLTLQWGTIASEETGAEAFVDAANGETLSKTPLTVPGGLFGVLAPEGLPKWLREALGKFVSKGPASVTATLELLATPSSSRANLLFQEGIALTLPVRIHLSNPFLGSSCYIGSKVDPITLELKTGTTSPPPPNEPITGKAGFIERPGDLEGDGQATILEDELVENAFSEPGASGCGGSLSPLIDPAVDARFHLPSAAGRNTVTIEDTFRLALATAVKNSE